jgi:hypothetical protein
MTEGEKGVNEKMEKIKGDDHKERINKGHWKKTEVN